MNSAKVVNRQDLLDLGANRYLIRLVTRSLHPIQGSGKYNIYLLNDVIAAIRHHLSHPRTKPKTQEALHALLTPLLRRLDNVINAPFGKSIDERIGFQIERILNTPTVRKNLQATPAMPRRLK
jgi:hypothetical protein